LFGEGKGTTPVESAMWKERFARRVQDRERRMRVRAQDLDRRRSIDTSDDMDDEDEAERAAQADDEEVSERFADRWIRMSQLTTGIPPINGHAAA